MYNVGMVEEIEIKRKNYQVIEQISDHSFKVERKGKYFLLKKFDNDPEGFEKFTDCEHRLRVSGVSNPKCYLYDKKLRWAILDYIEGENCFDILKEKGALPEEVLELMFKAYWYARNDRMALDMKPDNFVYTDGKLYYMPFKYEKFVSNDTFVQRDLRLWFFTKDFVKYCHDKGIDVDQSQVKSDYETNKNIALMTVKYYR